MRFYGLRIAIAEELHYFMPDICWSRLIDMVLRDIPLWGYWKISDYIEEWMGLRNTVCPASHSCYDQMYYYCGLCDPGLDVDEFVDGKHTTPEGYLLKTDKLYYRIIRNYANQGGQNEQAH